MIPLRVTAVTSATDAAIHKNMFEYGRFLDLTLRNTSSVIYNEEMNNITKIIKSLEESVLLIKCKGKTSTNEAKEQKEGFLGLLLGTLGASLLENLLADKGTITASEGTIREV